MLPAGRSTPLTKRDPTVFGFPMSSLRVIKPSRLRSCQQGAPAVVLQLPFDWLLPHESVVVVNRPPSALASVIFVL